MSIANQIRGAEYIQRTRERNERGRLRGADCCRPALQSQGVRGSVLDKSTFNFSLIKSFISAIFFS